MHDGAPETLGVVPACAEKLERIVLVRLDLGIGRTREYASQMLYLELLRQGIHQLYHQAHLLAAVECGLGIDAVVAAAAVLHPVILPEVVQQQAPAATAGLGVSDYLGQKLTADLLLGHRLALHELFELADILVAVVGDAAAFLAVTSGTSCLLVIALYALGDVVVDDETHVGLVDTHAEGYGSDYHVDLLHQEGVLVLRAGLGVKAGMVGARLYVVDTQQFGKLLDLLAAEAVDDAGLAGILLDVSDDVLLRIDLVADLVEKVGTVERRLEHLGPGNTEVLEDVMLDLRSGGSGESDDRSPPDLVHE